MKKIVITRHPALVELLRERHPALIEGAEVVTHVEDPSILNGADAVGVLPMHLAARCRSITEVPLALEATDRGAELTLERLRMIASEPVTYVVTTHAALGRKARDIAETINDWYQSGAPQQGAVNIEADVLRLLADRLGTPVERIWTVHPGCGPYVGDRIRWEDSSGGERDWVCVSRSFMDSVGPTGEGECRCILRREEG